MPFELFDNGFVCDLLDVDLRNSNMNLVSLTFIDISYMIKGYLTRGLSINLGAI